MTATEFASDFSRMGQQPLNVVLHLIANRLPQLRLADGQKINDQIDASAILREIAEALRNPVPEVRPSRFTRAAGRCSTCDHEHEGRTDCGKYLGEGKFCQCEEKVPA